jgi:hypothetical protein
MMVESLHVARLSHRHRLVSRTHGSFSDTAQPASSAPATIPAHPLAGRLRSGAVWGGEGAVSGDGAVRPRRCTPGGGEGLYMGNVLVMLE